MKVILPKIFLTLIIITILMIDTNADLSQTYFPAENWRTSTPQEQDVDVIKLDNMMESIKYGYILVDSITIIRNGYLIYDEYFEYYNNASLHQIYSVTKSVISALIGIANNSGLITDLDQPILDIFSDRNITNVDANKEALTIRHLLMMQTGISWGDVEDTEILRADDWVQYILDRPMFNTPGQGWYYTDAAGHLLSAIIQEKTNMTAEEYAVQHLFSPLGITNYLWESDPMGITLGFTGLWLQPHDMAKFGYLYLNNGAWNGTQVVTSEWVQDSIAIYSESDSFFDYGYLWIIDPDKNFYYGFGMLGQFIYVKPDDNLVVVITASDTELLAWGIHELFSVHILQSIGITITEITGTNTEQETVTITSDPEETSDNSSSSLNPSFVLGPIILYVIFNIYQKKSKGSH